MKGTILAIRHQENAGPGYLVPIAAEKGYEVEIASFAEGMLPAKNLSDYRAIVILGGTPQVDQEDIHPWLKDEKAAVKESLETGAPVLGICLGAQLMAEATGAHVGPTDPVRIGWGEVTLESEATNDPLFSGLPEKVETIVWHKYEFGLPPAATPLGRTPSALQAFRLTDRPAWAVQFHPEQPPENLDYWLKEAVRRGDIDEEERIRQVEVGEQLREDQQQFGRHLFGRFLAQVGE